MLIVNTYSDVRRPYMVNQLYHHTAGLQGTVSQTFP